MPVLAVATLSRKKCPEMWCVHVTSVINQNQGRYTITIIMFMLLVVH